MDKKYFFLLLIFFSLGCLNEKQQSEMILRHYIDNKVELIRNYSMESAIALWNASISGNEKDYQKLVDLELNFNKSNQNAAELFSPDRFSSITQNIFTNEQDFQLLEKLKNSGSITDTLLNRQLTVLYQSFMGPQIEAERYKKLINAETKLWKAFSAIKVEIEGKKYGIDKIDSIRKNTSDKILLKKIYNAYREQGKLISGDIIQMVKLRNEFAGNFGYTDFYQLTLEIKDQTPERIKLLLDEIELKTRDQFFDAKRVIDKLLAKRYHISTSELAPWHYHDERTSYLPLKFSQKMDSLYRNTDPIKKASAFFVGIGLPIQDVIDKSDLEYRSAKSSATYMFNIDFKNDLRLLSNIENNLEGMKRMMHLCGHTAQYKTISDNIPYLLKAPNVVVSEGVACFFENLATNYNWIKNELDIDSTSNRQYFIICQHLYQVDRLFRSRKLLVISEFEREIYRDPDQNLGELWHQLNQKYLGISLPEDRGRDDWAINKYSTSLSCTIHNYVLADLFAAQLQHTIEKEVFHDKQADYKNNKDIGYFLVSHLFKYGDVIPWEQLIEKATGEPLNPMYFVKNLLDKNGQSMNE